MKKSAQHAFNSEAVMAYLDGELELGRAAMLASHLEHCEECRAVAAQFRQLSERLLDFEIEPSPESMGTVVLGALHTTTREEKSDAKNVIPEKSWEWRVVWTNPYSWALAGALAAVLIVAGMSRIQPGRSAGLASQRASQLTPAPLSGGSAQEWDFYSRNAMGLARQAGSRSSKSSGGSGQSGAIEAPEPTGPMIAQTTSLTIVAANYDEASAAIDRLAAADNGYVQKLAAEAQTGSSRQLSATLRVPATNLANLVAQLRKLGHVQAESRANDEVTDQYVDLQARLKSARASEQRLLELQATRTGKLADVLDVERELARVREEIESMEGQRVLLAHRVDFATVDLQLEEEYRATLDSRSFSIPTRIWNATVEGFDNLEAGSLSALVLLLTYGPSVLFWLAILLLPAWLIWKRFFRSPASKP